jgi:hypothetical protein
VDKVLIYYCETSFLVQIKFITGYSEQTHKQIWIVNKNYFNRKVYTTDEKKATKRGLAWEIETDSIVIKEKCKHWFKMSDKVSRNVEAQALKVRDQRKYS